MPARPRCFLSEHPAAALDSQYRRFAGDIRGSDISAAALAHIFSTKDAYQQISERNRSQQVAHSGDDQERWQGALDFCCATADPNPASLVYFEPPGESWLW